VVDDTQGLARSAARDRATAIVRPAVVGTEERAAVAANEAAKDVALLVLEIEAGTHADRADRVEVRRDRDRVQIARRVEGAKSGRRETRAGARLAKTVL